MTRISKLLIKFKSKMSNKKNHHIKKLIKKHMFFYEGVLLCYFVQEENFIKNPGNSTLITR
jgi:hypothetical protein